MGKSIRKIISNELFRVLLSEDYDYASEEIAYHDKNDYEAYEAEISSALSFMQDIQSSSNNIKKQVELSNTNQEVDKHLLEAKKHIDKAIQNYFKTLSPDVKLEVIERLGEINIDI